MTQSTKYSTKEFPNSVVETTGFTISTENIIQAIEYTNELVAKLPKAVFSNIDYKAISGLIGACFCTGISHNSCNGAIVNPIEKGYPDIVPATSMEELKPNFMNYPNGIEVKCTVGSVRKGNDLNKFEPRINQIDNITWQAHHREGKHLLELFGTFLKTEVIQLLLPYSIQIN
ncbi:hypothetical protein D8882_03365 [Streptococcus sanguinis]|uniref:hypothetical protein n=1 Tax=Streptococcus sanguinis TaxID=1305 RepID=UPI000F9F5127|nr:hypothetical protein [Streptococcus sanguinis]RSI19106.1 hypothetical protein D8882_03365 [Streptococcus sanguinis]